MRCLSKVSQLFLLRETMIPSTPVTVDFSYSDLPEGFIYIYIYIYIYIKSSKDTQKRQEFCFYPSEQRSPEYCSCLLKAF